MLGDAVVRMKHVRTELIDEILVNRGAVETPILWLEENLKFLQHSEGYGSVSHALMATGRKDEGTSVNSCLMHSHKHDVFQKIHQD